MSFSVCSTDDTVVPVSEGKRKALESLVRAEAILVTLVVENCAAHGFETLLQITSLHVLDGGLKYRGGLRQ